jgi:hypothetical protein
VNTFSNDAVVDIQVRHSVSSLGNPGSPHNRVSSTIGVATMVVWLGVVTGIETVIRQT